MHELQKQAGRREALHGPNSTDLHADVGFIVKRALPSSLFISSRWKMRTHIARVPRASGSDARSGVEAGLARRSRLLAVTQLILLSSPLYRERLSVRCILRQNVSSADDRQAQGLIVVGSGVVLTSSG